MAVPTRSVILWDNIADGKTYSVYGGYGDASYPASNLHDNDIHTVARTTDGSGATRYFVVDLGSSLNYDTVALANCNIISGVTDSYLAVGNGITGTVTGFANYVSFTSYNLTTKCAIHYFATTQTARYIAVRVDDAAVSYYEIGELWVGMKLQLRVNPKIPIELIRNTEITEHLTGGGQRWTYPRYKQHGYRLKFMEDMPPTGYGSFASIEEVYEAKGFSLPFFFHNITYNDTSEAPIFVHATEYNFSIDGKNMRPGSLTLEEEI